MQNFHGSVGAFHVKTVDTTGAGDAFVGALLTKIVDDQSVLEVSLHLDMIFLSSILFMMVHLDLYFKTLKLIDATLNQW